jgi:putative ABC transport system substrate-binding protein
MTGFTSFEPGIGGKWLETLAELAPPLERCLVLVEPNNDAHRAFLRSVQSAGQARRVAVFDAAFGADEDGTFAQFAREPRGGLVVLPSPAAVARRAKITALAVQYGLPAVYPYRFFVMDGGLAAYGVDTTDLYRRAGEYVDRILKGAKPADLPVQQPTKYELVINLRTAKAMRLAIPPTVLARADEVIE